MGPGLVMVIRKKGGQGSGKKEVFLVINFTPDLLSKQLIEKHVNNVSSCSILNDNFVRSLCTTSRKLGLSFEVF